MDGDANAAPQTVRNDTVNGSTADFGDVPRNAPCPCGSGKKFKRCHGDPRARVS
jgi:preprotein translocase subunit SecA